MNNLRKGRSLKEVLTQRIDMVEGVLIDRVEVLRGGDH